MPLGLVEKICEVVLVTEEEPILAFCADGFALFHESAEGGDAGARTNHDHGGIVIGGDLEVFVRSDEDVGPVALGNAV